MFRISDFLFPKIKEVKLILIQKIARKFKEIHKLLFPSLKWRMLQEIEATIIKV